MAPSNYRSLVCKGGWKKAFFNLKNSSRSESSIIKPFDLNIQSSCRYIIQFTTSKININKIIKTSNPLPKNVTDFISSFFTFFLGLHTSPKHNRTIQSKSQSRRYKMRGNSLIEKATILAGLASNVDAFWRLPCRGRTGVARIDPLVNPGTAGLHAHSIHGSSGMLLLLLLISFWEVGKY